MAIDSTAKLSNVKARVYEYLHTLTISGGPSIADVEEGRRGADDSPWLRVSIEPGTGINDGRFSATQTATRTPLLIILDLFFPGYDSDRSRNIYTIDDAAADLVDSFLHASLGMKDYAIPSSPVAISDASIFFLTPPTVTRLAPAGSLVRRQVTAVGWWHSRKTA